MSKKSITQRIRAARKKLGLSQGRAAQAWGFSKRTLEVWDQGKQQPSGLYLEKLEKVLRQIER
jgi:DNA-binding transcriptional regulator YiaG